MFTDLPRRRVDGFSYVELLISLAVFALAVVSLSSGLTHGLALSGATRARTTLLNAAQAEMEKARGVAFDLLAGYAVSVPGMSGEVRVETLTARRKRVSVILQDDYYRHQRVVLVTYVHQRGLNP